MYLRYNNNNSAIEYIDKTIIGGTKIRNINFLKNFFFWASSFGIGFDKYLKIENGYAIIKETKKIVPIKFPTGFGSEIISFWLEILFTGKEAKITLEKVANKRQKISFFIVNLLFHQT